MRKHDAHQAAAHSWRILTGLGLCLLLGACNPVAHEHKPTSDEVNGVDLTLFMEGAITAQALVDCTLSDGASARCHAITIAGYPVNHEVGPFCPPSIRADAEQGGIWFDGQDVYDVDGDFILSLATLYNDEQWRLYDEQGRVRVTNTLEAFEAAARPDVDPAYQNYCVEGRMEWLENGKPVTSTLQIPATPVRAHQAMPARGILGVTLNGVVIAASAPVDAILGAHTIAPFDDCGGHINPFEGYHLHGARGCSEVEGVARGETPMFAYAMDGYPIHSPLEGGSQAEGLDACQGHSSAGLGYHYHAASPQENAVLSCFKGFTVEMQRGAGPARGHPPGGPPPGGKPPARPPADHDG